MNVLIKESQPLTAFGIHQLLENEFTDVNVNLASNVEDAFTLFYKSEFDMFIIDTELSLIETEKLIKTIRNRYNKAQILIYGNKNSSANELHYISMGANGFITKNSSLDCITNAIKMIQSGQVYISHKAMISGSINGGSLDLPVKRLSRREHEVYKLLIKGHGVNQISRELNLKQTTISTMKRRILHKLKVKNIAELVVLSTKIGYN